MKYHQIESGSTGRTFELDDDGVPSRRQLLEWLREAEDDLGGWRTSSTALQHSKEWFRRPSERTTFLTDGYTGAVGA